jgi:hypothetical protein
LQGLFGRRDALLLVLAATGMTFTDLTRLRRRDIRLDGDILVATTRAGERFRLPPDPENRDNPAVQIYRRWAEIQTFLDQHPGTHLLRPHLTDPVEIITGPLDAKKGTATVAVPDRPMGSPPACATNDTAVDVDAGTGASVRPGPDASGAACSLTDRHPNFGRA